MENDHALGPTVEEGSTDKQDPGGGGIGKLKAGGRAGRRRVGAFKKDSWGGEMSPLCEHNL